MAIMDNSSLEVILEKLDKIENEVLNIKEQLNKIDKSNKTCANFHLKLTQFLHEK